ncbi:MAG TPA: NAD-dependent epimerase/dehydratase family protein [Mycobacteriales bacterium]|nr:NAD-dependent epimerase/dehydratase family protein [Mycobacteriales bacterium]
MSRVFVTGGTGLAGANICQQLVERGDAVRALVRNPDEAASLAEIGVELVQGDITDADDVVRASKGCEAAIHSAALLGGSSQNLDDFRAVNLDGTTHVLDAGKAHGMRRVVALSTSTFFDLSVPGQREDAPLLADPPDDPYTVTKLAAYREVHRRAESGDDVLTCHPGAIYGLGLVVERALHRTSFNRVLLSAIRGKIAAYLRFPVTWVAASDVASGSIAALDHGVAGARYWLIGRPEDELSTAEGCNVACELAGVDHRVVDLDHRTASPNELEMFGPTLYAIAEAAVTEARVPRSADNPTRAALGYEPIAITEGMQRFVDWLRRIGRL